MLISKSYRDEQRRMHENERYGSASKKFAHAVIKLIKKRNPQSILDYGAGKCALFEAIAPYVSDRYACAYDPGIKAIATAPRGKFQMVCCIDVLEHVEPDCLDDVLADLRLKTGRFAFITIHTGPAGKFLSDGRNAHLIQEDIGWWVTRLSEHFRSVKARMDNGTTIIAICET